MNPETNVYTKMLSDNNLDTYDEQPGSGYLPSIAHGGPQCVR